MSTFQVETQDFDADTNEEIDLEEIGGGMDADTGVVFTLNLYQGKDNEPVFLLAASDGKCEPVLEELPLGEILKGWVPAAIAKRGITIDPEVTVVNK